MIQKRWIRGAVLSGVLVLPMLTAGCGLFSQETSKPIDPPQIEVKDGAGGAETGQAVGVGEENQMTVYLEDRNGYLAPISLQTTLGTNEVAAQKALEMMVENGAYANQLPEDFRAVIPQRT